MAYLAGGQADKEGNQYENNYCCELFFDLLNDSIDSIQHEKYTLIDEGIDIYIKDKKGEETCVQCKMGNGSGGWDISSFKGRKILEHSVDCYKNNKKYKLVTYAAFRDFFDILKIAKSFESTIKDFKNIVISGDRKNTGEKLFYELKQLGLGDNDILPFLRNFNFKLWQFDKSVYESRLNDKGYSKCYSTYSNIYKIFEDGENFGKVLNKSKVEKILLDRGIDRVEIYNDIISDKIKALNNEFKKVLQRKLVKQKLTQRSVTEQIIDGLEGSETNIIFGNAGTGKSVVLYEFIEELEKKDIDFFALNLQNYIESTNKLSFFKSIGLNSGIANTLAQKEKDRMKIIIFDQLDAIRTTDNNSSNFMNILAEEIEAVKNFNKEGYNFKILISCRTMDKDRFDDILQGNDKEGGVNNIKEFEVELLSNEEIKKILGNDEYSKLSSKKIEILKVFNNLKIYSKLKDKKFENSLELIIKFYDETEDKIGGEIAKLPSEIKIEINEIKNTFIKKKVMSLSKFELIEKFHIDKIILNKLVSYCVLDESEDIISFYHQSLFDHLVGVDQYNKIIDGDNIGKVFKKSNDDLNSYEIIKQVFELLYVNNRIDFYKYVEKFIYSESIRLFFKNSVITVLKNIEKPSENEFALIDKIMTYKRIGNMSRIFYGNRYIAKHLYNSGILEDILMQNKKENFGKVRASLESLKNFDDDAIIELSKKYLSVNKNKEYVESLVYLIDDFNSSEKLFDYKIELLSEYEIENYYVQWDKFFIKKNKRIIKYILLKLDVKSKTERGFVKFDVTKKEFNENMSLLSDENYETLYDSAKKYIDHNLKEQPNYLVGKSYGESQDNFAKDIFFMSIKSKIKLSPNLEFLFENLNSENNIIKYYSLGALNQSLSSQKANSINNWMIVNNYIANIDFLENRLFLKPICLYLRNNVMKFDNIVTLLDQIYNYKSPSIIEYAKRRLSDRKVGYYYTYYGEEQYHLYRAITEQHLNDKNLHFFKLLKRKFENTNGYYYHIVFDNDIADKEEIHSYNVVSGIAEKAKDFGYKAWQKIINKNDWSKNARGMGRISDDGNTMLSYEKRDFCNTARSIAKSKQELFIKLSLDNEIKDDLMVSSICYGLSELGENEKDIIIYEKFDSKLQVFKKYFNINNKQYLHSLLDFYKNYDMPQDEWLEEKLLEIIKNPDKNEELNMNIWRGDWDKDFNSLTSNDLDTEKINRIQTIAVNMYANKLYEKKDISDVTKEIVEMLISSKHPAVQLSTLDLLYPLLNADAEYAIDKFLYLVNKDYRFFNTYYANRFINYTIRNREDIYKKLMKYLLESNRQDIFDRAIEMIVSYYIYYGYFKKLLKRCYKNKQTYQAAVKILKEENKNLTEEEYESGKDRARKILKKTGKKKSEKIIEAKSMMIDDDFLLNEKNKKILLNFIKSSDFNVVKHNFHQILYLLKKKIDLNSYIDIIKVLVKKVIKEEEIYFYGFEDLFFIIFALYNDGNEKLKKECLNSVGKLIKKYGYFSEKNFI